MQGINSVKNFEWIIKSCTVSLSISFAVPITMQQIMRGVRLQYVRQIRAPIPCGILGHVWYLIVSFPDLCHISYFPNMPIFGAYKKEVISTFKAATRTRRAVDNVLD